jgi:hypothetical protein
MMLLAGFALVAMPSCRGLTFGGSGGELAAVSMNDSPVEFSIKTTRAVYDSDEDGESLFYLSDMDTESLVDGTARNGRFLAVRLLWNPRPGKTPMDASATNASVLLVILSDGEVGVYGGAGYALPHGTPGQSRLGVTIRESTLTLLEATEGFNDLLSPSLITGSFVADHDPLAARAEYIGASQLVTNALGTSTVLGTASWRR